MENKTSEDNREKPNLIEKIESLQLAIRHNGQSTFTHKGGLCFISTFLDELQSRIKELEGALNEIRGHCCDRATDDEILHDIKAKLDAAGFPWEPED